LTFSISSTPSHFQNIDAVFVVYLTKLSVTHTIEDKIIIVTNTFGKDVKRTGHNLLFQHLLAVTDKAMKNLCQGRRCHDGHQNLTPPKHYSRQFGW
jgi:hypothetical protein